MLMTANPVLAASVDPALCNALTKHAPDADVAYQAGVDVNGKPVVPVDVVGSNAIQMPSTINIPLTVSLAKILNLDATHYPASQLGSGTEAWLGTLTVEGDRVLFDGKPLNDAQQDNLAVLCMKPRS